MHHYSYLRRDLPKKIRNSSGLIKKTSTEKELVDVKDYFNLKDIFS